MKKILNALLLFVVNLVCIDRNFKIASAGDSTSSSDFVFEPKVWSDHIQAYFDRYLVYGAFALRNEDLKAEGTGLTVNFPYFKAISDAEEPAEDEALTVDSLSDDSFSATVFEVGKAVGFKKKAFKKSAASSDRIMSEAQRQIARVHAEKVDKKLQAEMQTSYTQGYLATDAAGTMNIRSLNSGKIAGFGDKHKQSEVCFMHSLQFLDLMNDTQAGFLKADASDPMYMVEGFEGRMLGMAIVTVDTVEKVTDIDGKDAYRAMIAKENAYGIMNKQDMEMDSDKDILNREIIVTGNEWYAVKNFDRKISSLDKKLAAVTTTVSVADGV
jgi:hypothetical protein